MLMKLLIWIPERIRMTMMEKTSCNKVYEAAGRWTVMISEGGME
jgi:hypothetical protein